MTAHTINRLYITNRLKEQTKIDKVHLVTKLNALHSLDVLPDNIRLGYIIAACCTVTVNSLAQTPGLS